MSRGRVTGSQVWEILKGKLPDSSNRLLTGENGVDQYHAYSTRSGVPSSSTRPVQRYPPRSRDDLLSTWQYLLLQPSRHHHRRESDFPDQSQGYSCFILIKNGRLNLIGPPFLTILFIHRTVSAPGSVRRQYPARSPPKASVRAGSGWHNRSKDHRPERPFQPYSKDLR